MRALGIVTIVAGLAVAGCTSPAPPAAAAQTATPELPEDVRHLAESVAPPPEGEAGKRGAQPSEDGSVGASGEFVSPVRSELSPRLPGRVGEVLVDVGDRVLRGQPLLALETQYLALDAERADAELQRAEAAETEAARDFARKKDLMDRDSVAPAVYERTRAAAAQATAAVAAARAARDLARQRLEDAVLRSPIDGIVMERRTDVGERLGDSSVAFVLLQTAPLKLRFRLPERYLPAVARGQVVRAEVDPFPGEVFEGRLSAVVDAVDPASRTFLAEAEFSNADERLRPGLFARVELQLASPAPTES